MTNARILRLESSYAVRYLLPPNSVARFHLLFPDPWPKRRHQTRRVVDAAFLDALFIALIDRGTLRLATDQEDYFEWILFLVRSRPDIEIVENEEQFAATTFEERFIAADLPIHRLMVRKLTPER